MSPASVPRKRFLLTLWEGGGTLPPELGIARQLIARGHAVHVLADPTVEDDARAAGCTFSPWRRAPHRTSLDPAEDLLRDWEVRNPLTMLKRVRDVFVAGPAGDYAADTLDAIEAVDPQAVISDFMLFGAIIAAEAARVPAVPVVPNIWMLPTPGSPAIGPGFAPSKTMLGRGRDAVLQRLANRLFATAVPTLDAVRAVHGLPPLSSFHEQVLAAERILVLTSPTFDFAAPTVPSNVRYVGPVLDDPHWAAPWTPPWTGDGDSDGLPLVLVAFSSTYQNQGPLLRRIVEALSTLPLRAVVTLGQMLDPAEVSTASNVTVVPSAPHGQILPQASAVVTHCGHGITMKALAAGLPLLCIPMGRDQNDTAARVVHHGAGLRLPPSASAARIGPAVERVLRDGSLRAGAERLAAAIAREVSSGGLITEIEAVVAAPRAGAPSDPAPRAGTTAEPVPRAGANSDPITETDPAQGG